MYHTNRCSVSRVSKGALCILSWAMGASLTFGQAYYTIEALPDGQSAYGCRAVGINEDGFTVGNTFKSGVPAIRASYWSPAADIVELAIPPYSGVYWGESLTDDLDPSGDIEVELCGSASAMTLGMRWNTTTGYDFFDPENVEVPDHFLPPTLHYHAFAHDINNARQVVGTMHDDNYHGYVWHPDGRILWLDDPDPQYAGRSSTAWAINDNGTICGAQSGRPALWQIDIEGVPHIQVPHDNDCAQSQGGGFLTDINNNGICVGMDTSPAGDRPAIWLMDDYISLSGGGFLRDDNNHMGLNDHLQIVSGSSYSGIGYYWQPGCASIGALTNMLSNEEASRWSDLLARDINNSGWITGYGLYEVETDVWEERGFVMKPINELPPLATVVSRRYHGASEYNIPIELDRIRNTPSIESRTGGPTLLVVSFNRAMHAADSILNSSELIIEGATLQSIALSQDGMSLTIELTSIPNLSCPQVIIQSGQNYGLVDASGRGLLCPISISLGAVEGDVNASNTVDIFDLLMVRAQLDQPLSESNFRCDIDANGAINIFDLLLVRSRLDTGIPGCLPDPICPEGGCLIPTCE